MLHFIINNTFRDQVLQRLLESGRGWTVHITDGIPHWTPPAWLDPTQQPRRNTAHHIPDITFDDTG